MMIWKFPLTLTDEQTLLMPKGATILSAQYQLGSLCIWALVDPEASKEPRHIYVFGTGQPISSTVKRHIGTVQQAGGQFVWHIFE